MFCSEKDRLINHGLTKDRCSKEVLDAGKRLIAEYDSEGAFNDHVERMACAILGHIYAKQGMFGLSIVRDVPKWWTDRMGGPDWNVFAVPNEYAFLFDHCVWLKMKETGDTILMSQPYASHCYNKETLRIILTFCDKYRLSFSMTPESEHFPGRTIAIYFYPDPEK